MMPLSQEEGNKLFENTPDIMLGELHRMGPKLRLCNFFKFLILPNGFILLSFWLLPLEVNKEQKQKMSLLIVVFRCISSSVLRELLLLGCELERETNRENQIIKGEI